MKLTKNQYRFPKLRCCDEVTKITSLGETLPRHTANHIRDFTNFFSTSRWVEHINPSQHLEQTGRSCLICVRKEHFPYNIVPSSLSVSWYLPDKDTSHQFVKINPKAAPRVEGNDEDGSVRFECKKHYRKYLVYCYEFDRALIRGEPPMVIRSLYDRHMSLD